MIKGVGVFLELFFTQITVLNTSFMYKINYVT